RPATNGADHKNDSKLVSRGENNRMDITEFLEARISEDEAAAREAIEERSRSTPNEGVDTRLVPWLNGPGPAVLVGPERVLAECVVKRSLIEHWGQHEALNGPSLLIVMAMVYADHPDYQQEWAL
ncbi:MAG: DUF6221 family protein, partial [Arthrobacter sp.]